MAHWCVFNADALNQPFLFQYCCLDSDDLPILSVDPIPVVSSPKFKICITHCLELSSITLCKVADEIKKTASVAHCDLMNVTQNSEFYNNIEK